MVIVPRILKCSRSVGISAEWLCSSCITFTRIAGWWSRALVFCGARAQLACLQKWLCSRWLKIPLASRICRYLRCSRSLYMSPEWLCSRFLLFSLECKICHYLRCCRSLCMSPEWLCSRFLLFNLECRICRYLRCSRSLCMSLELLCCRFLLFSLECRICRYLRCSRSLCMSPAFLFYSISIIGLLSVHFPSYFTVYLALQSGSAVGYGK